MGLYSIGYRSGKGIYGEGSSSKFKEGRSSSKFKEESSKGMDGWSYLNLWKMTNSRPLRSGWDISNSGVPE
jgi:hypothetical protein